MYFNKKSLQSVKMCCTSVKQARKQIVHFYKLFASSTVFTWHFGSLKSSVDLPGMCTNMFFLFRKESIVLQFSPSKKAKNCHSYFFFLDVIKMNFLSPISIESRFNSKLKVMDELSKQFPQKPSQLESTSKQFGKLK